MFTPGVDLTDTKLCGKSIDDGFVVNTRIKGNWGAMKSKFEKEVSKLNRAVNR